MRKVESINFRFGGRSTTFCSSGFDIVVSIKSVSNEPFLMTPLSGADTGNPKLPGCVKCLPIHIFIA